MVYPSRPSLTDEIMTETTQAAQRQVLLNQAATIQRANLESLSSRIIHQLREFLGPGWGVAAARAAAVSGARWLTVFAGATSV